jgi:Na+-driven multidrug efflux pump
MNYVSRYLSSRENADIKMTQRIILIVALVFMVVLTVLGIIYVPTGIANVSGGGSTI